MKTLILIAALAAPDFFYVESPTGPRGGSPNGDPPAVILPPRGLRLEIDPSAISESVAAAALDVTLHTTSGCPPCERMKAALSADARLNVTLAPLNSIPAGVPLSTFPFVTFRDDAGTLRYNGTVRTADDVVRLIERTRSGRMTRRLTPSELRSLAATYRGPSVSITGMTPRQHLMDSRHGYTSDQLAGLTDAELRAIHSADHHGSISPFGARSDSVAASRATDQTRAAGAIHGKGVIRSALAKWRETIGDGAVMVSWTRNGSQLLPLLRLTDWTPRAIYGSSGAVQFNVTGAPHSLPVTEALIDYRLVGGQLRLRGETSIDAGLLGIDTGPPKSVGDASQVVGFIDPISLLSAASLIWGLLNPQADLTLPGAISATATMRGDELLVTFTDAPSVRIVMLFTFTLRVESVSITTERVVLKFSGSRWIAQKTFEVRE